MITDGTHPDVAEIDAARYNGVDAIRDLSDNAGFAPALARLRIYILDEVHMLSTPAWNALLKLLEEPPPHLRFIFATTEVAKVLPTVVSRVQRFDFRAIDSEDIVARLKTIAVAEGLELAEPLLYRLARAAGGGMRDAQTLLDQLLAVSDGKVSEEDLNLLLGAARGEDLLALANDLGGGRAAPALEAVDRIVAGGVAPATLIDQLVDHFRALLLVQACGSGSPAVRRLGLPSAVLAAQAKALSPEKALRICQLLLGSQQALRQGVESRLQLELACVRIAGLGQLADLDTLLRRLERLEAAAPATAHAGGGGGGGDRANPRPR
jgi:DNA polymerase-3 subunit gamma/tau